MVVIVWYLDLQLPMQSVPIDTKLCDKVCQSLAAVWWFSPVSTNKTDRSNITDMSLKLALNTKSIKLIKKGQWIINLDLGL